jgi:hypothetical protein
MNIKEMFKESVIRKVIDRQKKAISFNEEYAESYQLPQDANETQNNSYYFSCHDMKGSSLLFRLGKRGGNTDEVWFAYKDCLGNVFVNTRQLFLCSDGETSVKCLETGKIWEFSFKGKLSKTSPDSNLSAMPAVQEVDAAFKGVFTATNSIFEFSHHMDSATLARALAREKWSRGFISGLRENHQVHYEQQGHVAGTLFVDKKVQTIECAAMRDHSYGKRDWAYMDRHIWIMALMENGDALNVNMVRYPAVSELQAGYLAADGKITCLHYATSMDKLECSGRVPNKFQIKVKLVDNRSFEVSCEKELEYIFPFDNDIYTIFEGIGNFNIEGLKGRGIIEFGFNKDSCRWTRETKE